MQSEAVQSRSAAQSAELADVKTALDKAHIDVRHAQAVAEASARAMRQACQEIAAAKVAAREAQIDAEVKAHMQSLTCRGAATAAGPSSGAATAAGPSSGAATGAQARTYLAMIELSSDSEADEAPAVGVTKRKSKWREAFDRIPCGAWLQVLVRGEMYTLDRDRQVVSKSGAVDRSIHEWWARLSKPGQAPAQYVRVNGEALFKTKYYGGYSSRPMKTRKTL